MAVDPLLLKVVACPSCRGELRETDEGRRLVCDACRRAYEVRVGVPVLTVHDSLPLESPKK